MKNFSGTSLLVTAVLTAGFTTTAMGQVANDECSGAIAVVANTPTQFDTTAATASADAAPVDTFCTGTFLDWGTGNKDVWFTFTPTESGLADFSTCFAGGFDTSMVLYTGSCGALTQVGCNGDAPADAACQQFFSKISAFAVTAGTTYTIRVGGWNGVEFGIAALTVTLTPTGAGCPGTESCGTVHATPGCSDATCCTNVCAANPLCCDIGWDATCVSTAIQLCGIYVHQCITPAAPNDCAPNATVFSGDSSFSIANTGYNTDGPNHPAATCSSGNDVFLNDVWYRAQAQANGTLRVYTCNSSTFDTKVAVYNMGTNPAAFNYDTMNQATVLVGCNDDGSADCQVGATFASDLSVSVVQGNWYLIRCGTYDIPGTCTLFVNMPEPCSLPAQTGVEVEACGSATNNGCNAAGETETGVTIMLMDEGLDTGPILSRRALAIGPTETSAELTARLAEVGAELLLASGDERNESRHEVNHEVVGAPDLCLQSHFDYGARVGYGRITDIEGAKLTVNFEKAGVKKVVESYVKRT